MLISFFSSHHLKEVSFSRTNYMYAAICNYVRILWAKNQDMVVTMSSLGTYFSLAVEFIVVGRFIM